jgi:uncharacterized protein (DUF924 family)
MKAGPIIDFWFKELKPADWFGGHPDTDRLIRERFLEIHSAAALGELADWRDKALGRLAEIIVLDQFSRNIHRGEAAAFSCDGMALVLSQEAIRAGADRELTVVQKSFLYMPFMHSESKFIHETAVRLFRAPGMEDNFKFEMLHKKIIDRFGRYPHRNQILGRVSTPGEIEFLKEPGSSF